LATARDPVAPQPSETNAARHSTSPASNVEPALQPSRRQAFQPPAASSSEQSAEAIMLCRGAIFMKHGFNSVKTGLSRRRYLWCSESLDILYFEPLGPGAEKDRKQIALGLLKGIEKGLFKSSMRSALSGAYEGDHRCFSIILNSGKRYQFEAESSFAKDDWAQALQHIRMLPAFRSEAAV
jgi:hypothetical protein